MEHAIAPVVATAERREISLKNAYRIAHLPEDEQQATLRRTPLKRTIRVCDDALQHLSKMLDIFHSWEQFHGTRIVESIGDCAAPQRAELRRLLDAAKRRAAEWFDSIEAALENNQ